MSEFSGLALAIQIVFGIGILVLFGAHAVFGKLIHANWASYPLAKLPRWYAGFLALFPLAFFLTLTGISMIDLFSNEIEGGVAQ